MKKKILIGSILVFLIMLMLPSIPALEYNATVEEIRNMGIDELEEKLKDNPGSYSPNCIISLILLKLSLLVIRTVASILFLTVLLYVIIAGIMW